MHHDRCRAPHPQFGFMLKLPTPRVVEPNDPGGAWLDAGIELQFENEGEVYRR